ncbi:MAG: DUF1254 domain-containing protein [Hydrogenophilaceae bacterium]|jgi:hypothetical protein|nr:DUF1254 domain-containing protein [Hydrogenophilaceae bacterium]
MSPSPIDPNLTDGEISALAEEAYLYACPMLIAYGFFHRQIAGPAAPERQALNRFTHFRELASPALNNTIPWVNTDTLYSAAWLDLRAEPFVLSNPAFEAHRFHDIQANDWFTMCFLTRGTRDVGNGARTYLIAGPDWTGAAPDFVDEVIVAESWIIKLFARVVVENEQDAGAIHALQDQYVLHPLSGEAREAAPLDLPAPERSLFVGPFYECPTPAFIRAFNAIMPMAAIHPSERELFDRFARIGAKPGARFDEAALSAQHQGAIQAGIDSARERIAARLARLGEPINGWTYPLDLRGGREVLAGSADAFLRRAVLAKYAIWGPPAEEVVYMNCDVDAEGAPLNGADGAAYRLHFDGPPPAKGFWSLTVYDSETRLLAAHPSGRYKRGDRDRDMARGADGSLTLFLQHRAPASEHHANWLPVPEKGFQVVARLYWPDPEVLSLAYKPPPIERVR